MTSTAKLSGGRGRTATVGVAAAGLVAGLLLNLARKTAVQAPTLLAGEWDEALAAEHKATLAIFDLIEKTSEGQDKRRTVLLTQLKHALAKHALQEENAVYPMLRDKGLVEGADHLNHEHGYVKQYLFDLTELPRDDPAWLPKVKEFRALIEKHVREEEDDLFPKLRALLDAGANKHLTAAMNREGFKIA